MTRVLHVSQPVEAGVARYVVAACTHQSALGWQVAVACPPDGSLAADLRAAGIQQLDWSAGRSPGPASLAEARRLGRLIEQYQPQVLHLHASKAGLAGRLAVRGRVPTLFQPHGWSWLAVGGRLRPATIAWERLATRWTDRLICVGQGEAEQGRAERVAGRYEVVRNGVDTGRFQPPSEAARARARIDLGVHPTAPVAVCVGRLTRQKGQDVLLAAWPGVLARCPGAELVLVGDGDLEPQLRALAGPGVRFAGAVPDVRDWLAVADVVVLPSRWEGLSLTALEALAAGRSVVVSDVPGLAELITPEVGALVPADHPTALTEALTCRLGDLDRTRAEGVAAVGYASGFDARATFDRLAEVTEAAVQARWIPRPRDGHTADRAAGRPAATAKQATARNTGEDRTW